MLTLKLASSNLRKNLKVFLPFLLAALTVYTLLFLSAAIGMSPSINRLKGGASVSLLMNFALFVLTLFGVVILLYSYRFLQLQRSKEYGLYHILGFGKSRMLEVLFYELFMLYLLVVFLGSLIGFVVSKLLFWIFVLMIGGNYFSLEISATTFAFLFILFALFFVFLIIVGGISIFKSSGLDLLKKTSKGEREPKTNGIWALLSLIILAGGYYLAASVQDALSALTTFFIAVLLVILGTYLFYISFTIWYLKLRKKRSSYYKPRNFITISALLYRMKQNATGLGNITVLLAMTLVTLVLTLSIFIGTGSIVAKQFPREGLASTTNLDSNTLRKQVENLSTKSGVGLSNLTAFQTVTFSLLNSGNVNRTLKVSDNPLSKEKLTLTILTQSDFKNFGNETLNLSANQAILANFSGNSSSAKTLQLLGEKLTVIKHVSQIKGIPISNSQGASALLVVSDAQIRDQMLKNYNASNPIENANLESQLIFDLSGSRKNLADQEEALNQAASNQGNEDLSLSFKTQALSAQKAVVGGFLFIGFVLGVSFIFGAALIIYYKQLSEGIEDKRSYEILQEVGLSQAEVAKTIKTQVRMVFFLPIIVAIVHFAFAFPMISQLVALFSVTDTGLVLLISLSTALVLFGIYFLIYQGTSRVYYRIVKR